MHRYFKFKTSNHTHAAIDYVAQQVVGRCSRVCIDLTNLTNLNNLINLINLTNLNNLLQLCRKDSLHVLRRRVFSLAAKFKKASTRSQLVAPNQYCVDCFALSHQCLVVLDVPVVVQQLDKLDWSVGKSQPCNCANKQPKNSKQTIKPNHTKPNQPNNQPTKQPNQTQPNQTQPTNYQLNV